MIKTRLKAAIVVGILLTALNSAALCSTFTFSLLPEDGIVIGPPGSTVGWGYSLSNLSTTEWLVPTGLNAGAFAFGTPFAIFDFPILGPAASASVPFDSIAGTGLYQLIWDPSAPDDYANFGRFALTAEWWDGDPFNGGSFSRAAPDAIQAYFAMVAEDSAVPEPSVVPLLSLGLGLIIGLRSWKATSTKVKRFASRCS